MNQRGRRPHQRLPQKSPQYRGGDAIDITASIDAHKSLAA